MSDILYPIICLMTDDICILSYYKFDVWYFVFYPIIGLMSDILYPYYMFEDWYFVSYPILGLMSDILYPIL